MDELPAHPRLQSENVIRRVSCLPLGSLVVVSLIYGMWNIENIPGLNGDEAWYGVKAMQMLQRADSVASVEFWRTPTGNLLNPFFMGLQVLVHAIFGPSMISLRAVAVASGILVLPLNFWLCRKQYDQQTAWYSTTVFAVLPVAIAYSRLAWDASQTMLFTIPVVYLSIPGLLGIGDWSKLIWLHRFFLMAVIVHPTNVFLVPFVFGATGVFVWTKGIANAFRTNRDSFIFVVCLFLTTMTLVMLQSGRSAVAFPRLFDLREWVVFGICLLDLFSGVTVYEYFSGIQPGLNTASQAMSYGLRLSGIVVFSAITVFGTVQLRRGESRREARLCFCYCLTLLAFFVAAGPSAIQPGFERYGLCLIAPAVIIVSALLSKPRHRGILCPTLIIAVVGVICLTGFHLQYFAYQRMTGGNAHMTFRTADKDPKQLALERILKESTGEESRWIVTDQWWCYWSLRYFSTASSNVNILRFEDAVKESLMANMVASHGVWFIVLDGDPLEHAIRSYLKEHAVTYTSSVIDDYGQKNAVWIFHAKGKE